MKLDENELNMAKMLIETMTGKFVAVDATGPSNVINLMELTCAKLMEQCLEEGKGSVGMSVEVKHLASTPCGMKVRCEAEITEVVNGKKVNIPSYLVKAGDVIEIKEKNKGSQRYKDILEVTAGNMVPDWLEVDAENLKGEVKELPKREAIDVPVDEMLIVELYSK